jgi:transposase
LCNVWFTTIEHKTNEAGMQLKVILNSIEKYKGFIYSDIGWDGNEKGKSLLIKVKTRKGSKGFCSGCGKRGPCYDTGKARRFQYVPLWGITVFLINAMRRINCKTCSAPTVEMVPWADGKKQM